MKIFFTALLRIISTIVGSMSGKQSPPQVRCSFCGEAGHTEDDCPKAAKYKMFGERE
jgi:hypothetical protein